MSAPNLHVALAMALGRKTSDSDAALIAAVYRLQRRERDGDLAEPIRGQLALLEEVGR